MKFDWSEYLTLAKELTSASAKSPIKEASLRSAISRAYYAAFCTARNHLASEGNSPSFGENVHWYVVNEFENSSDVTYQIIGQLLRHLRATRNIIDYKDEVFGNLLQKTKGALVEAEEVFNLLEKLNLSEEE